MEDRITPAALDVVAVGGGAAARVRVFDADTHVLKQSLLPYGNFTGGVRVTVGDVNGDGVPEVITAPGPGRPPLVKVFDANTGAVVNSFFAFNFSNQGGVNVAAGDVNGDNKDDIIVAAGARVKILDGTRLNQTLGNRQISASAVIRSFVAFNSPGAGGVRVAAGDVDGDTRADIIVGRGAGAGPHVKVFSGVNSLLLHSLFAFGPNSKGGVNVAAGDVNGDGRADIIAGEGAGSLVKVFSGVNSAQLLHAFRAFGGTFKGGVRVAAGEFNNDGKADIVVSRAAVGGHVKVFDGLTGALAQSFIEPGAHARGTFVSGTILQPYQAKHHLRNLYVFRSPTNANNTVFIMTLDAFAAAAPTVFAGLAYRFNIDTTGDGVADRLFEATFGIPDAAGVQPVTLAESADGATVVVAQGNTGQNLAIGGGGMFRSAIQDDPFFFDKVAYEAFIDNPTSNNTDFPRPLGAAQNAFGPNVNTFAITIEVPSNRIGPVNSLIGVWGTALVKNNQLDRIGRPITLETFVPPVPRGPSITTDPALAAAKTLAFITGSPATDVANHAADMRAIYQGFYQRTQADATALTSLFLPDFLIFQLGNPNGLGTFVTSGTGQGGLFAGTVFGNGRRLRDDVIDIMFNINTNGLKTTDNVPDDNGTRITDGNMGTVAAFPYIGAKNP